MQTVRIARLGLREGAAVLDLGCGAGRHLHAVLAAHKARVVGLDLAAEDLVKARDGLDLIKPEGETEGLCLLVAGDALRLPFADDCFDCVICSEVLEHIDAYEAALAEIARVLKPGGRLGLSVPRRWPEQVCWLLERAYHEAPGGHVRIFKAREIIGAGTARGFRLIARHAAHALHTPYWWLQCAFWRRRDDLALIRAYHRFLVWDLMKQPKLVRWLEQRLLDPWIGKSAVFYFVKGRVP